jgi:hypothetical protein
MKNLFALLTIFLAANVSAADKAGAWKPLLDANLSQFDVYLSYRGDQIQSVLKGTAPAGLKPVGFNPPSQNPRGPQGAEPRPQPGRAQVESAVAVGGVRRG